MYENVSTPLTAVTSKDSNGDYYRIGLITVFTHFSFVYRKVGHKEPTFGQDVKNKKQKTRKKNTVNLLEFIAI